MTDDLLGFALAHTSGAASYLALGLAALSFLAVVLHQARLRREAARVHDQRQMADLITSMQAELRRTRDLVDNYTAQLDGIRSARWGLLDHTSQIYEAAIAAQAMVHDLERRLGLELTQFPAILAPAAAASNTSTTPASAG